MLIEYKKANIYQSDSLVLEDVCFEVEPEQFVYVIGKVGTGKSSLLKTMYCELDIDKRNAEKAEVLGRNLLAIKRREVPALRREMGVIFRISSCCTTETYTRILNSSYAPQDGSLRRR